MAKGKFPAGMGGGMNMNMMRQVQKMQEEMMRAQAELETRQFTAAAGGGVVTATVDGKFHLVSLDIKPEAVDPDDVEMLQDLIVAAVTEAQTKAEATVAQEMGKYTGGLNLGF